MAAPSSAGTRSRGRFAAVVDDGDYGRLKAGCERAALEAFGESATVVRAGLLLGPHENVGRLPWWLRLVDARDVADVLLSWAERRTGGTFIVTGPRGNATMGSWLQSCVDATGSGAELTWVDDRVLLERGVEPWTELPLWMPPGQGADHAWDCDTAAAGAAGLTTRPVDVTVRDTWEWLSAVGPDGVAPPREGLPGNGIDPDKERSILAAVTTT